MRRQNSQYIVPSWLKWGMLGLIVVLISCLVYLFLLYSDIQQSRTTDYENSKNEVLRKTSVSKIGKTTDFYGEQQFHVIFGTTKNDDEKIVFVPIGKKKEDLTVIDQSEIIPRQQVVNQWERQCKDCKLIDVTPAMQNNEPLWELTYVDASKRYVFDYFSIFDGKRLQRYQLKSIFN
ncbi:DUF5590 domain-containing protein [Virgibacillus flavescens]|uniref:cell wall elongation regulator TseB-like domain-containing protein n=1 Tax=Virgibacillus flavescens TaxID=1611422 RepID=UPI003D357D11